MSNIVTEPFQCINTQVYIDQHIGSYEDVKNKLETIRILDLTSEHQYFINYLKPENEVIKNYLDFLFKVLTEAYTIAYSSYDLMSSKDENEIITWIYDEFEFMYLHNNRQHFEVIQDKLSQWIATGIVYFNQYMNKLDPKFNSEYRHQFPIEWKYWCDVMGDIQKIEYTIGVI